MDWWTENLGQNVGNNVGRYCDAKGSTGRPWKVIVDDGICFGLHHVIDDECYLIIAIDSVTNLY